jgi:hypothetical protein
MFPMVRLPAAGKTPAAEGTGRSALWAALTTDEWMNTLIGEPLVVVIADYRDVCARRVGAN